MLVKSCGNYGTELPEKSCGNYGTELPEKVSRSCFPGGVAGGRSDAAGSSEENGNSKVHVSDEFKMNLHSAVFSEDASMNLEISYPPRFPPGFVLEQSDGRTLAWTGGEGEGGGKEEVKGKGKVKEGCGKEEGMNRSSVDVILEEVQVLHVSVGDKFNVL